MHHRSRATKDAEQAVVITCRDGVLFVVVATGAGDGGCLEGFGEGVELVVDDVVADHSELDATIMVDLAKPIKRGADQRLIELSFAIPSWMGHQVTRDMLADELIVGEVVVERSDHVVAIAPGEGNVVVPLVAVGFREPHDVEPVSSKPLPKARRREQAVD